MSSDPDLRASRGLDLLLTLEEAVAAFVKKEGALTRDFSSRRFGVNRRQQEADEQADARLAAQTAEVEAAAQAEEQRVRAIHESRRARIRRAHEAGLRNLPRRARDVKEGWMGELQMRRFNAQQKQAADLKTAQHRPRQLQREPRPASRRHHAHPRAGRRVRPGLLEFPSRPAAQARTGGTRPGVRRTRCRAGSTDVESARPPGSCESPRQFALQAAHPTCFRVPCLCRW